jgi:tight adherence protein B
MSPTILLVAVFVGVTGAGIAVVMMLTSSQTTTVEGRLQAYTSNNPAKNADTSPRQLLEDLGLTTKGFLQRLPALQTLFTQTGTNINGSKFMMATVACGLGGGVLTVFAGAPMVAGAAVGVCCCSLPFFALRFLRKRRLAKFAKQLPEALELVSRALRAGHSLASGISLVSSEMPDPIGPEFAKCYEEQNLGIPLEEALENFCRRVPNLDLRFFVTAVILQRQTGGDLAEILDKIGSLIRDRFKIFGQIQALTGEGRLSGIVLLVLPPGLFVAMYRLNPEYSQTLFTDPMGRQMLGVAIVMQFLGALVIRKIIDIKV